MTREMCERVVRGECREEIGERGEREEKGEGR